MYLTSLDNSHRKLQSFLLFVRNVNAVCSFIIKPVSFQPVCRPCVKGPFTLNESERDNPTNQILILTFLFELIYNLGITKIRSQPI